VPLASLLVQWWEAVLVALAGVAAGAINAAVGSGTLITFPALVAMGFNPLTANVSNNIGLVPGAFAGAWGYRREIGEHRASLARLIPCAAVGGVLGAVLLLVLPAGAFEAIVPVLIALALVLVVLQPRLARRLARESGRAAASWPKETRIKAGLALGVFGAGIYGGYFGAAQGVLFIGILGSLLTDDLQAANGLKNVLSTVVNGVAAVTFVLTALDHVDWLIVVLIAGGSTVGGLVGAAVGRRLPPVALRGIIVVVGLVAIVKLVFFS
jgi:uncharacterized membrane protein YfcA